jgi:hypothetical protein
MSGGRCNLKPDIIEDDQYILSRYKNHVIDGQAAFITIAEVDDELVNIADL